MKKFLLYPQADTSDHVIYEFDGDGRLIAFRIEKDMNPEQFKAFKQLLPYHEPELHAMLKQWKDKGIKYKLEEQPLDLSFDKFYNNYGFCGGEKRNRIRAIAEWNKLSDGDKVRAITYTKKYTNGCKLNGTGIKHPDTYLKNRVWLD